MLTGYYAEHIVDCKHDISSNFILHLSNKMKVNFSHLRANQDSKRSYLFLIEVEQNLKPLKLYVKILVLKDF